MDFKFFRGIKKKYRVHHPLGIQPAILPNPYEPMRENRYLVQFPEEYQIQPWMVKSTSRPTVRRTNVGLMEWDDIEFKFYDPIGPSIQRSLNDLLRGEEGINRPIEVKIQMLGPVGDLVSEWLVMGLIREINFGELSYDSGEMTEVTFTMSVLNAVLNF